MEIWQIKRVRRLLDLTQEEMAYLLGTSACTVLRYERGSTRPDAHVVELLQILTRVAEDAQRVRQIQELLRREVERSLVLWYVLDTVYCGRRVGPT